MSEYSNSPSGPVYPESNENTSQAILELYETIKTEIAWAITSHNERMPYRGKTVVPDDIKQDFATQYRHLAENVRSDIRRLANSEKRQYDELLFKQPVVQRIRSFFRTSLQCFTRQPQRRLREQSKQLTLQSKREDIQAELAIVEAVHDITLQTGEPANALILARKLLSTISSLLNDIQVDDRTREPFILSDIEAIAALREFLQDNDVTDKEWGDLLDQFERPEELVPFGDEYLRSPHHFGDTYLLREKAQWIRKQLGIL
jgi:hypothetical protein